MTESEYIKVRNLSVVIAARAVLRDYLPMDKPHDKHYLEAMKALTALQDRLFAIVRTKEDA